MIMDLIMRNMTNDEEYDGDMYSHGILKSIIFILLFIHINDYFYNFI